MIIKKNDWLPVVCGHTSERKLSHMKLVCSHALEMPMFGNTLRELAYNHTQELWKTMTEEWSVAIPLSRETGVHPHIAVDDLVLGQTVEGQVLRHTVHPNWYVSMQQSGRTCAWPYISKVERSVHGHTVEGMIGGHNVCKTGWCVTMWETAGVNPHNTPTACTNASWVRQQVGLQQGWAHWFCLYHSSLFSPYSPFLFKTHMMYMCTCIYAYNHIKIHIQINLTGR